LLKVVCPVVVTAIDAPAPDPTDTGCEKIVFPVPVETIRLNEPLTVLLKLIGPFVVVSVRFPDRITGGLKIKDLPLPGIEMSVASVKGPAPLKFIFPTEFMVCERVKGLDGLIVTSEKGAPTVPRVPPIVRFPETSFRVGVGPLGVRAERVRDPVPELKTTLLVMSTPPGGCIEIALERDEVIVPSI
jgi:hypothetical protein